MHRGSKSVSGATRQMDKKKWYLIFTAMNLIKYYATSGSRFMHRGSLMHRSSFMCR